MVRARTARRKPPTHVVALMQEKETARVRECYKSAQRGAGSGVG